jgi:hypothetical protein
MHLTNYRVMSRYIVNSIYLKKPTRSTFWNEKSTFLLFFINVMHDISIDFHKIPSRRKPSGKIHSCMFDQASGRQPFGFCLVVSWYGVRENICLVPSASIIGNKMLQAPCKCTSFISHERGILQETRTLHYTQLLTKASLAAIQILLGEGKGNMRRPTP